MVKDFFLHNGGQRNAFAYVSRSNPSGCFFNLLKGPDPSYSVLKFGDNLSSRNRDMAQSVILYSCDLERSRSSVRSIIFGTALFTLPMSIYICQVSLKSYCQLFRYGSLKVARRKRKKERKNKKKQFDGCSHFVTQITP